MISLKALALCLALGTPQADAQDNAKAAYHGQTSVELGARYGGSVGNALLVPIAYAFPGGSVRLRTRQAFGKGWFGDLQLSFALGAGDDGTIASYRAMATLGYLWVDTKHLSIGSDVHLGLASYSLFPLPRAGLNTFIEYRVLVLDDLFNIFVGANGFTDVHLIAPAPGGAISTGAELSLGPTVTTFRVNAGGEAFVAILANSLGGAVAASLSFAFRY